MPYEAASSTRSHRSGRKPRRPHASGTDAERSDATSVAPRKPPLAQPSNRELPSSGPGAICASAGLSRTPPRHPCLAPHEIALHGAGALSSRPNSQAHEIPYERRQGRSARHRALQRSPSSSRPVPPHSANGGHRRRIPLAGVTLPLSLDSSSSAPGTPSTMVRPAPRCDLAVATRAVLTHERLSLRAEMVRYRVGTARMGPSAPRLGDYGSPRSMPAVEEGCRDDLSRRRVYRERTCFMTLLYQLL